MLSVAEGPSNDLLTFLSELLSLFIYRILVYLLNNSYNYNFKFENSTVDSANYF